MYRPSGIAVVTAGLAALALFHVVWGRDARHSEPLLQQDMPTAVPEPSLGTTFQLNSGAWRAWRVPIEETPATAPIALSAPEAPTGVAPETTMTIEPSAPVERTEEAEPRAPALSAGASTYADPITLPVAKSPMPPPAEGRMTLGGLVAEPEVAHVPSTQTPRPALGTRDRASPVPIEAAAPSESKFGPAVFKRVDGNGP